MFDSAYAGVRRRSTQLIFKHVEQVQTNGKLKSTSTNRDAPDTAFFADKKRIRRPQRQFERNCLDPTSQRPGVSWEIISAPRRSCRRVRSKRSSFSGNSHEKLRRSKRQIFPFQYGRRRNWPLFEKQDRLLSMHRSFDCAAAFCCDLACERRTQWARTHTKTYDLFKKNLPSFRLRTDDPCPLRRLCFSTDFKRAGALWSCT